MTEDSKDRRGEPEHTDTAPGTHSTQEIPAVQPGQGYPQSGYVVHEQQPSMPRRPYWAQPDPTQRFPGPEAGPE